MRRRRRPGRDRGSFTAELAAGLPALMLLLGFGLTAVTAVTAKMQCLDAAREAALAGARGAAATAVASRIAPEGAAVRMGGTAESVTAEVSAPVRMFGADLPGVEVRATAVAAREPEEVGLP
ncbi:TadE family type IV pilus minor pilin [Actinoplanes sp. NEAU-A12]|uniref:TadE family type IV pilus minor pilin n=1 Tax=Actinoplanes sandaracinus TaxID=3045177 RepID=A0ABT6WLM2_9ACTN|nr:TadE family type IV pilus minor pilin [Actinoplanes sandaracinus]MDI6100591.1 TadE family type IV pilus minor pilin [Actinoplanes sandaracinus]